MEGNALYGYEIEIALNGCAKILSRDQLSPFKGPFLAVCNTSNSNKPGSHWVVICIDKFQQGEFFDSFGLSPDAYGMGDSFKTTQAWRYNDIRLQQYSSYAIAYCRAKLRGLLMRDFLCIFSKNNYKLNDSLVYRYVM